MGGQTHPTFHPTLVFSMLDEMLDAFDQGFSQHSRFKFKTLSFQLCRVSKFRVCLIGNSKPTKF